MKPSKMWLMTLLNGTRRNSLRLAVCAAMFSVPLIIGCQQSASISGGVSQKQGPYVQATYTLNFDPPGSSLSGLNLSQALLNVSMSNATLTSTSGTATVTVTNESGGATLGQQSFGYVVSGSSVYAQDPTAVQSWLNQFSGYADVDVSVTVNGLTGQNTASSGTASATASAQYQGTTYASTTSSWDIGGSSPNPCPGTKGPCPVQGE